MVLIFLSCCIPPQNQTLHTHFVNISRPIPILIDHSVPYFEVVEAECWLENQTNRDLFQISPELPQRSLAGEIIFVPWSVTISADFLDRRIAGQTTVETNNQNIIKASRIEINQSILHDHTKLQVTLRHELGHVLGLPDLHCSNNIPNDIMCGDGDFNLDAPLSQEEINFILEE